MPELCRFFGIIIYMYREIGGKHHYPHIHADYAGQKAVFNIETAELIEGRFPNKERKLVEAWIELRKNELRRNWSMLNTSTTTPSFSKIDPLS
ncbi:DUF4160 domain-containing protein [Candidatus Thiosymbion oneisti]|uniref:DUF4160 domain-containing protein n=1 Tax=Candidatus Thiosymbion oneisti TaxID=589554 RepID=UPI000B7CC1D3|nr:DUF4160 domain-containing protein [Candidatus Thiosymbion oneisti]